MEYRYNLKTVAKFYALSKKVDFDNLTDEKIESLNALVNYWRYFFVHHSSGLLSLMTFTAEKMITSNGRFGVITIEEKLYFYLQMVDPDFLFLEAHETGNTMQEIKDLCKLNFHYYDPYLIHFEKKLYQRLNNPELLWARGKIKTQ